MTLFVGNVVIIYFCKKFSNTDFDEKYFFFTEASYA